MQAYWCVADFVKIPIPRAHFFFFYSGTTADVQKLIFVAVANLRTNLSIQSTLKLDDFQTDLAFVQNDVPTVLDSTVLYLTGLIGRTSEFLIYYPLSRVPS